jgi:hypothetical protein
VSDTTHPDDQTDDVGVLQDNLRHLRKMLQANQQEIDALRAIVASMKVQLEEEGELRQQWIDVFDMYRDPESGKWVYSDQKQHDQLMSLSDDYLKLIKDWNKFVPRYNAWVREMPDKPRGRPLGATEDQVARVRQLRAEGYSYAGIVSRTDLSLRTVRTIVTGPAKEKAERQELVRLILNKEAAARYRSRNKGRERIAKEIDRLEKKSDELIKAARRF